MTLPPAARRCLGFLLLACLATGPGCAHKPGPPARPTPTAGTGTPPALPNLQEPVVWIVGPVRWPVLDWRRDLTLARAILEAEYLPANDPRQILIHRGSVTIPIDPSRLLTGEDWALLPGDRVEIVP
jgi:hypothetical protein